MNTLEEHKKELITFYKEFKNILDKNNLWYIAEFGTQLGAVREGKMIEWDDDIDLGISIETYEFLKKNYPNNVLDTDQKGYPFVFPKWVKNKNNFLNTDIFIDIFLIVPTTYKKIKKYKSNSTIFRFSNQMFNKGSKYKPTDGLGKFLKCLLFPIQWTTKKLTTSKAIEMVYEKESPEINLLMNLPILPKKDIDGQNKRPLNIWERKEIDFHGTKIYIPTEYDYCLKLSYGNNYMTPIKTNRARKHIDTINSVYLVNIEKEKNK